MLKLFSLSLRTLNVILLVVKINFLSCDKNNPKYCITFQLIVTVRSLQVSNRQSVNKKLHSGILKQPLWVIGFLSALVIASKINYNFPKAVPQCTSIQRRSSLVRNADNKWLASIAHRGSASPEVCTAASTQVSNTLAFSRQSA